MHGQLPPKEEAWAAVAQVINVALAAERGTQDLSATFVLLPVAADEVRWGVFVPDPDYADGPGGELVSYGTVRVRRDGQLRYDPRGLYEPLAGEELGSRGWSSERESSAS